MTNQEYKDYCDYCLKNSLPIMPRDYGTPPHIFGMRYAGSCLKRKNDIRRKRVKKYYS